MYWIILKLANSLTVFFLRKKAVFSMIEKKILKKSVNSAMLVALLF